MADDSLYDQTIKDLARSGIGAGSLTDADGRGRADTPLCGDRAEVDIRLDAEGRVAEWKHRVRGCLICQASASALAEAVVGQSAVGVAAGEAALRALLAGDGQPLAALPAFAAFTMFEPLRPHRSRHGCALLPFVAAARAFSAVAARP